MCQRFSIAPIVGVIRTFGNPLVKFREIPVNKGWQWSIEKGSFERIRSWFQQPIKGI